MSIGKSTPKILRITAISLAVIIVVATALLCAVTYWLTPGHLSDLLSRELSEDLKADVRVSNARFTLWSSFPHFYIVCDSVYVRSRTLDSISQDKRRLLPENSDFLASCGEFKGGINLLKLISGRIFLHDVEIEGLKTNFVAVNDSINNYSIFPTDSSHSPMPYFTADLVRINSPKGIRYFSSATGTKADISLTSARLRRNSDNRDSYDLELDGKISAIVRKMTVLRSFPFGFDGKVSIAFHPFGIRMHDYNVALGTLAGKVDLNVELGDRMTLNDFTYRLDSFNLKRFLSYIPGLSLPQLKNIRTDAEVNASARLTEPYRFSSTTLPRLEVELNVEEGNISYNIEGDSTYSLHHSPLKAIFMFDGKDPDASTIEVPEFSVEGEGMRLMADATVENLTDRPLVSAHLNADGDIGATSGYIRSLRQFGLKGNLKSATDISFRLDDLHSADFSDINVKGAASVKGFRLNDKQRNISASADSISLLYSGNADRISDAGFKGMKMIARADGKNMKLAASGRKLSAPALTVSGSMDKDADNVSLCLTGNSVGYKDKEASVTMHSPKITLAASLVGNRRTTPPETFSPPDEWFADSAQLSNIGHSDRFLSLDIPARIKSFIERHNPVINISVDRGKILAASFPAENRFSNLRASLSPDTIAIGSLDLSSRSTRMSMNGMVSNLRQFVNSPVPAPLKVDLSLRLDTASINQLAATYQHGRMQTGHLTKEDMKRIAETPTASDTLTALVPRNLIADIRATAKETRYTNLRLYDLATRIQAADGDMKVDTLTISSDFGHAFLSLAYNTSNVQDMNVKANVGVMDIDLVRFFENFHKLLLMMPQMKNLSGTISAQAYADMRFFPDMYVNVPSLRSNIYIQGRGLKVHQNKFIRKITNMLFIPDDNDIHIDNMNVHASIHDNLLELYPFNFEFLKYRLTMGGLNNFDGKLYYHIGVDRSPVRIPFGINIEGYFHDPKLRFGGPTYKVSQAKKVSSRVMERNRLNLIREVKRYMHEFIEKAAESGS